MAAITRLVPSGSADGAAIKVAATATAGTLFHAADATAIDEIWMMLCNTDTVARLVTVEFGGATAPDNHLEFNVDPHTTIMAIPGMCLSNSKTVRVYAAAANVVTMVGYVNRIG